jgi:hypothetical protein
VDWSKSRSQFYLEGLKKTGFKIAYSKYVWNESNLKRNWFWAAVEADGFIPSKCFMEFQAYNVLVIYQISDN